MNSGIAYIPNQQEHQEAGQVFCQTALLNI